MACSQELVLLAVLNNFYEFTMQLVNLVRKA